MFRHLQEDIAVERRQASACESTRCRARKVRRLAQHVCRRSASLSFVLASSVRHCERSEAIQCGGARPSAAEIGTAVLDCFVASLLAVTSLASRPATAGKDKQRCCLTSMTRA
jgi:hypothetical protein